MGCRYGIDGRHGLSANFGSKLLEVVSIPPKKNDSCGTKTTQELVDPRAVFAREQFLRTVVRYEEKLSTHVQLDEIYHWVPAVIRFSHVFYLF